MTMPSGPGYLHPGAAIPTTGVSALAPATGAAGPLSSDCQACARLGAGAGRVQSGAIPIGQTSPADPCGAYLPSGSRPQICLLQGRTPAVQDAIQQLGCNALQNTIPDPTT